MLDDNRNVLTTDEIKDLVHGLLAKLPDTAEGAAAELERQGIKGIGGSSEHCVLAEYLRPHVPADTVHLEVLPYAGVHLITGQLQDVAVKLPNGLSRLAMEFDDGKYAGLELPQEE